MLKKVLFSDDKNTQQVHNICFSWIKIDLQWNFIVMILTRWASIKRTCILYVQFLIINELINGISVLIWQCLYVNFTSFNLLLMFICFFFQVICHKQTGSSLQHLGFRRYLEYCRCCIFYFVIQLLSEPDKQNCWQLVVKFYHSFVIDMS